MQRLALTMASGHLFATVGDQRWLLDTGSPASFGQENAIELDGQRFEVASDYCGLSASALEGLVGEHLTGLVGTDILDRLDLEIDVDGGLLTVCRETLTLEGLEVPLEEFMGVSILRVQSEQGEHRMFFDTGAQISYFQAEGAARFRSAGEVRDFYPGVGEFSTQTHMVPFHLGALPLELRCGRLPDLLGLTLSIAGVDGIVGNQICMGRRLGYFARRRLLVLA